MAEMIEDAISKAKLLLKMTVPASKKEPVIDLVEQALSRNKSVGIYLDYPSSVTIDEVPSLSRFKSTVDPEMSQ